MAKLLEYSAEIDAKHWISIKEMAMAELVERSAESDAEHWISIIADKEMEKYWDKFRKG